jgi:uncharacterized membrane protein HdeD (DUF308 family)
MGAICALELAMLSLPLVPVLLSTKAPHDEFYGLAMVGEAFVVGGFAALLGFAGGLVAVLRFYRADTARRIRHVLAAIAIAFGVALAGVAVFPKSNEGIELAALASGIALVIGLMKAFNTPIATD